MRKFYALLRKLTGNGVVDFNSKQERDNWVSSGSGDRRSIDAETAYKFYRMENKPTNNAKLLRKFATRVSGGILSKGEYLLNGKKVLVKGNTKGNVEPYAEYITSNLCKGLLYNLENVPQIVEYLLADSKEYPEVKVHDFDKVSVCEMYNLHTLQFYNWVRLREAGVGVSSPREYVKNNCTAEAKRDISIMILLDALTGNIDRHFNNWDMVVDTEGVAPLLDFGGSLLSNYKNEWRNYKKPTSEIAPDVSKPFKSTHLDQIRLIGFFMEGKVLEINNPKLISDYVFKQAVGVDPKYLTAAKNYFDSRCRSILAILEKEVKVRV